MGTYLRKTNFIEGVGNEVLFGIAAFSGILVPMIAYILNRQRQVPVIHPDSAANVESTRAQLRQDSDHQIQTGRRQARQNNNGQLTCPICLGDANFAVETNCGHIFCGLCIITYWQHQSWLGAVPCPSCRTRVTILLQNFSNQEVLETSEEKTQIIEQINNYNRRFSGEPRPWIDYIRDLPTLLRHAWNEFFTVGGLIWMFRVRVIICFFAALLYFISPLDIIPEAAFGILGFLDDLFIILLLAIYVSIIYRQIVEARAARGAPNNEVNR
ncbi:E3 ubiquitin-protein ligase RNF170-like [Pomacea canaliculata]|uniref:E3 ubiquitin-protein ligase RNF170-like n=1 Tax=Pomacea canaliculata TaxID=400727 RepID=UPI000D72AF7E|nr:E3 ubiquitin-protein ligase RNF170-like [Pomacea canaliculata]